MVDDHDEQAYCYRHPNRETALSCKECERPVCTECAIHAAVGIKCADCARMPRAARAHVPTIALARATAGAAVAVFCIVGIVDIIAGIPFVGLIAAWVLGAGAGTIVLRSAGGFRQPPLDMIAAAAAALGYVLPVIVEVIKYGPGSLSGSTLWTLLAAVIAAVAALRRFQ